MKRDYIYDMFFGIVLLLLIIAPMLHPIVTMKIRRLEDISQYANNVHF